MRKQDHMLRNSLLATRLAALLASAAWQGAGRGDPSALAQILAPLQTVGVEWELLPSATPP